MKHNKNLSEVGRIGDLEPERIAAYLEQTGWHFYAQNMRGDRIYGLDGDLLPSVLANKDSVIWLALTTELIQKVAKKEDRSVEAVVKAIQKTMTEEEWADYREQRLPQKIEEVCEAFRKMYQANH